MRGVAQGQGHHQTVKMHFVEGSMVVMMLTRFVSVLQEAMFCNGSFSASGSLTWVRPSPMQLLVAVHAVLKWESRKEALQEPLGNAHLGWRDMTFLDRTARVRSEGLGWGDGSMGKVFSVQT